MDAKTKIEAAKAESEREFGQAALELYRDAPQRARDAFAKEHGADAWFEVKRAAEAEMKRQAAEQAERLSALKAKDTLTDREKVDLVRLGGPEALADKTRPETTADKLNFIREHGAQAYLQRHQ
jgi:hypothetical protein